jgi:hypothetical protein
MLVDLSITEMRVIHRLLVHDHVNVVEHSSAPTLTPTNRVILMEKLFVAIEGCRDEARWIQ